MRSFQTILTGIAAGVIFSIPVVLLLNMREIPLVSFTMACLCILMTALLQCLQFTERWTDSIFTVRMIAGGVSMGIGILYAYTVSRNSTAFSSLSVPVAVSHGFALAVMLIQQMMKKKG
ncbi:MAG: hypothetical protein IKS37_02920 [Solobacterium sp.]|nr:hypothetical protein [Solobacterium sp.]